MNMHQLRCAVTVARLGSQTRAAEALYMSQPNLSKALKDLEQVCGFRIFERTSTGMAPTRKGEAFLTRARALLEQMDAMDAIYQGHNRVNAYLSVAIPRASYISHALTAYVNSLDMRGGMELSVHETSTPQIIHEVVAHEADMGVIRYPVERQNKILADLGEQGLHYLLYWKFRHVVILSGQHPLAREKQLHKEQLLPYVEIVHGDTLSPFELECATAEAAAEPVRKIHVYERGSQFDLLAASPVTYMWVSPVPQAILTRHGLVQLPCLDEMPEYQDALIYLKGYSMSPWERAFYDLIRGEVEKLS